MPKVTLKHDATLTREKLQQTLTAAFKDKYTVIPSSIYGSVLIVKKDAFNAAYVRLKVTEDTTTVVVNGNAPNPVVRFFFGLGLLGMLILGRGVTKDVTAWFEQNMA